MKKQFILGILLFVSLVFFGCSNKDENTIQKGKIDNAVVNEADFSNEFAVLNTQLNIYNQNFMSKQPAQFRGGKFWKKAKADITGAAAGAGLGHLFGGFWGSIIGGIIGGVTYSLAEPDKPATGDGYEALINNDTYILPLSQILNVSDSIGYFHNKIIEDIISTNPNINNESKDVLFNTVVAQAAKYGFSPSNEELSELKVLFLLKDQIVVDSDEQTFENLRNRYPDFAASISLAEMYYNNISQLSTDEQILEYTTGFCDIVSNSDIPEASADLIASAATVGMNSRALWIK